MRRDAWFIGVVMVSLGLFSPARAEPQSWVHNRWTTEDGLPQNSVGALATDSEGYLWLGTQEGLVRYDGQRFTVFGVEAGLSCPIVQSLTTTARGDIAVGTDTCGAYLVHHGAVSRIPGVPADARVRALATTSDGALLIATDRGLLSSTEAGVVSLYDKSEVTAIAVAPSGDLYFAVHGAVGLLHAGALTWLERARFVGDKITSLAVDQDALWIASRAGLSRTSPAGTLQLGLEEGLPSLDVQAVAVIDRQLWVATGAGAARYDGRRFVPLELDDAPRHALSLLSGGPGTLWVGDSSTGLHQLRPGFIERFGPRQGLVDPVAWSLLQDRSGAIWAGTEHGGLHRLEAGRFKALLLGAELSTATITALAQAPDGTLWAGTTVGVFHWDGARGELFGPSAGLPSREVYSVVFDAAGTQWIGTSRGLVRREPGGPFVDVTAQLALPAGVCQLLVFDAAGQLWLGGPDLFGYLSGGRFISQPLGGRPNVVAMLGTARGVLVATGAGLGQVRAGHVRWLDVAHGLFPSGIIGATQTADDFWFTTNRGPFRIAVSQLEAYFDGTLERVDSVAYGVSDGMTNAECNSTSSSSVLTARDGRVWIPTVSGISVVDPSRLHDQAAPPNAVVEGVKDPTHRTPMQLAPQVTLAAGTHDLEIHYTAPQFSNAAQVTFRYQLEGNDRGWVEAGTRRSAWYTNLRPGTYQFLVQARLPNGAWSATPASIRISLERSFYETWWFLAAATLCAGGVVIHSLRGRSSERLAHEAELQRRVEDRTLALKVALERSAQSEASFRMLTEQLPIAVTVTSLTGRIVYANEAAARLTGCESVQHYMTFSPADFAHPEERAVATARAEKLRRNEPLAMRVGRLVRRDGTIATTELWGIPVTHQGEPAVLSLARDITDRVAMEQKLQSSERLASIGTLAAGVAHEINNPLAFVLSNLSFISEETKQIVAAAQLGDTDGLEEKWAESQQALADAWEGAKRVQRIVSDLKTFSRPTEDGDGPIALQPVIDFTLNMCRNELRHRAQLVLELAEVPTVFGNAHRLGQVLMNLLLNAAQAIPDGAVNKNQITLRSGVRPDGRVFLEVTDTGCGIPAANLSRLFDPFFTTKPVGVGTGLGLSICHGILAACGGELQVESEEGKGSVFRVLLKVAADMPLQTAAAAVIPASGRGTILVVDDEPLVAEAVRRTLAVEHDVAVVTEASDALVMLQAGRRFDCIVSDLMMPRIGGAELHAAVADTDLLQADRMVFLTGGAFTETSSRFASAMKDRCIDKPFTPEGLRSAVNLRIRATRVASKVC